MESNKQVETFDVDDVVQAECNLEPVKCRHCGSLEVTYHQYQVDAYCSDCGEWQNAVS